MKGRRDLEWEIGREGRESWRDDRKGGKMQAGNMEVRK